MEKDFNYRLRSATKWSAFSEIMAKLVVPISNMILARILAPEVFGIVASVNTIISFCDIFADAGFQKYIIQNQESNKERLNKIQTVAFWTNLAFSVALWVLIGIFVKPIAASVGCDGKEAAVIVASANLPLHAITSIQTAHLRRKMDFRTLFFSRIVTIVMPFVVTIPLALMTHSYWALIIGTIASNLGTSIGMTILVKWKPMLLFDKNMLKEMLGFGLWSMLESFLVWVINWGDTFIISAVLTTHLFGVYRTTMSMTNQIIGIVSASMAPVLLTALARQRSNMQRFKDTFYHISYLSGLLLIPMGIGIYIYRDTICMILLGKEWLDGADLMGIWGMISALAIVFNTYTGSVLVAMGRPKISAWIQLLQIILILPTVYMTARIGFKELSYARALVRIVGMLVYSCVLYRMYDISTIVLIRKYIPAIFSSLIMAWFGQWFLQQGYGTWLNILSILACVLIYLCILLLFPSTRGAVIAGVNQIKRSRRSNE